MGQYSTLRAGRSTPRDGMEIRDHRLTGVRQCPSPNCDARPTGAAIELVVIHGISLRGMRVSSHVLIHRTGACVQFVPFDRRAWHAGVSSWRGREGCNDFSVGVELEGTDELAYTDAQYAALERVLAALRAGYDTLAPDAVTGHSDIAPGRKTDPGPAFDWTRLGAVRP